VVAETYAALYALYILLRANVVKQARRADIIIAIEYINNKKTPKGWYYTILIMRLNTTKNIFLKNFTPSEFNPNLATWL